MTETGCAQVTAEYIRDLLADNRRLAERVAVLERENEQLRDVLNADWYSNDDMGFGSMEEAADYAGLAVGDMLSLRANSNVGDAWIVLLPGDKYGTFRTEQEAEDALDAARKALEASH